MPTSLVSSFLLFLYNIVSYTTHNNYVYNSINRYYISVRRRITVKLRYSKIKPNKPRKTMLRRLGNETYSLLFRVTHIDRRANVSQQ